MFNTKLKKKIETLEIKVDQLIKKINELEEQLSAELSESELQNVINVGRNNNHAQVFKK